MPFWMAGRRSVAWSLSEASRMTLRARLKSKVGSGMIPCTMSEARKTAVADPAGMESMACRAASRALSKRVLVPSLTPML